MVRPCVWCKDAVHVWSTYKNWFVQTYGAKGRIVAMDEVHEARHAIDT